MNKQYDIAVWNGYNPDQRSESMAMVATTAEQIYAVASVDVFRDTLRAARAKQALDGVAILASIEAQHLQTAPTGRDEYRRIIRAYAERAAAEIGGSKW